MTGSPFAGTVVNVPIRN